MEYGDSLMMMQVQCSKGTVLDSALGALVGYWKSDTVISGNTVITVSLLLGHCGTTTTRTLLWGL